MVEMTHSPSTSKLGTQFNAFLFASIGENAPDSAPESASVASALARLDIDPWQEAADLNRLSRSAASKRLALILDKLPEAVSGASGSKPTADRLVAYLPQPVIALPFQQVSLFGQVFNSRVFTVACVVVSIALMIAVNSLIINPPTASSGAAGHSSTPPAGVAP